MKKLHSSSLFVLSTLVGLGTGHSAGIIANAADFGMNTNSVESTTNPANALTLDVGSPQSSGSTQSTNGIFMFDVSSITGPVTGSSLMLNYLGRTTGNNTAFNIDLYGVGFSNDVNDGTVVTSYTVAAVDATETLLANDLLTPTSSTGVKTVSGAALDAYLNSNTGNLTYAFFRLNTDKDSALFANDPVYSFSSGNATSNQPQLVIPEPTSSMMLFGGASLMMLRRRRR